MLSRAVQIFEAFTPDDPALTVSEVARRTGLHLSTASRLVAELVAHDFLSRNSDRRVRMWELAMRASPVSPLREAAMPFMEGVHDVVGHHRPARRPEGRRGAVSGAAVGPRLRRRLHPRRRSVAAPRVVQRPGAAPPRTRGSTGAGARRPPAGIHTAHERLRAVLADIRREGYAFCPGYVHQDALGIAAPVHDSRGGVTAALAVIVPNEPGARSPVPVIRTAAHGI
ncbi:helix-turn-helix domain-containing protein [Streptomyces sp. NBC_00827]|uniref:helix-turn-helix domain-containing protein n=1 Tax=Streptomyces sp. NBC_00827 TaxID=2903677 RepID=UPI003864609E|nr:helix-turn-helix domain-containing protein [Streptomyces sp. NBC_00827]